MTAWASLVLDFGAAAADQSVVAEWDEVLNIDGIGDRKTAFAPGDSLYFILQVPATLTVLAVRATDGAVSAHGAVLRRRHESMLFAVAGREQAMACEPASDVSWTFVGATGPGPDITGRLVSMPGQAPRRLNLDYEAEFALYRLDTVDRPLAEGDRHDVDVVIYLKEQA